MNQKREHRPVVKTDNPPVLDLVLRGLRGLLHVRPLHAQPLNVTRARLDALLHVVDLPVQLLQLVVELLHLRNLRVELRVRGGDREPRVRVRLAQPCEREARVEDLAR